MTACRAGARLVHDDRDRRAALARPRRARVAPRRGPAASRRLGSRGNAGVTPELLPG